MREWPNRPAFEAEVGARAPRTFKSCSRCQSQWRQFVGEQRLLITTASPDRHRGPLPDMPSSWTSHSDFHTDQHRSGPTGRRDRVQNATPGIERNRRPAHATPRSLRGPRPGARSRGRPRSRCQDRAAGATRDADLVHVPRRRARRAHGARAGSCGGRHRHRRAAGGGIPEQPAHDFRPARRRDGRPDAQLHGGRQCGGGRHLRRRASRLCAAGRRRHRLREADQHFRRRFRHRLRQHGGAGRSSRM
jgi:hypothetical protein